MKREVPRDAICTLGVSQKLIHVFIAQIPLRGPPHARALGFHTFGSAGINRTVICTVRPESLQHGAIMTHPPTPNELMPEHTDEVLPPARAFGARESPADMFERIYIKEGTRG